MNTAKPKAKLTPPKRTGRKGGYVAVDPTPQSVKRNARDQSVAEDIMSELEADSGLIKLLDVLERPKGG